jgi:hypothetical protein
MSSSCGYSLLPLVMIFEVEGGASCDRTLFDLEVRDKELEELDVF